MADGRGSPLVAEVVEQYDEAAKHHGQFVRAYERRERSYRGVLQAQADAAKWNHKLHPPYAFTMIESIVANTIEENLRFTARPAPHGKISLEEAEFLLAQSEDVENLIRHEHRVDDWDAKQRPLFLTSAIGGYGVAKLYWNWETGTVKRQGVVEQDVYGADGSVIGTVPTIQDIVEHRTLRDHSTTEIVDPRDFIVHESAKALQPREPGGAQHVIHRCWYSLEQLRQLERSGFISNVSQLVDTNSMEKEYTDRETEVFHVDRTKDLVEVLEHWCYRDGQVWRCLVGNRAVELRGREANPFWHGDYPFITTSSMSYPFSIRGTSDVELIEQLQEIIWELTNQRLDNVELINNAIYLIRSDIEDPEAFEHYPGARWPVTGPNDVNSLAPPYQLAELTMAAEAALKGDMQNVTAASPFAGGADSGNIDQTTATGVTIVQNNAQKALASKKYQAQKGLAKEAQMRLKNVQQFADGQHLIHVLGHDGAMTFKQIPIIDIQGDYIVELEPMSESMMRQERRAEATQLMTTLGNLAPIMAAAGTPLNMGEVVKWGLRKWDIEFAERFLSAKPASMGAAGAPGAPPPGGNAPPADAGQPNMGITADTAVDASSPSTTGGNSASPVMMMQRAMTNAA